MSFLSAGAERKAGTRLELFYRLAQREETEGERDGKKAGHGLSFFSAGAEREEEGEGMP